MSKGRVCLSMIVKDEEKDIKRCLESVIPYIDYWVISDTGSSDRTMELIQEIMDEHKVPGELHQHEWEGFSVNRNIALELSRPHCDYIFFMDADDNFVPLVDDPFKILDDHDVFYMSYKYDNVYFTRAGIIKSDAKVQYRGALHEAIYSINDDDDLKRAGIESVGYIHARSSPLKRNSSEKEKYLNDAKILEEDLEKDPTNYRSMFYLGQSYQLACEFKKAINAYQLRCVFPNEGNTDEIFISKLEIAKIKIALNESDSECIDCCIDAWESCPGRIDSIVLAMSLLHKRKRNAYAIAIGNLAMASADPHANKMKLDPGVYDWKFPAVYAYCLAGGGNLESAIDMISKLLNEYYDVGGKEEAILELEYCLEALGAKKKPLSRSERRKTKKKGSKFKK